MSMQIGWSSIRSGQADALHDAIVELSGWMIPLESEPCVDYFLLAADTPCCPGCVPTDPRSSIEVIGALLIQVQDGPVTIRGRLRRLIDDPAGWRYQLVDARVTGPDRPFTRRAFLASTAALSLVACARGRFAGYTDNPDARTTAQSWRANNMLTMDMHSHAGRVSISRDPAIGANRLFAPLAAPMRSGGMNVVTLAIVTDTAVTRVSADRKRFEAYRTPAPGELYALGQTEFARVHALIAREQMNVITSSASLKANASAGPSAIIASEGGDFLEDQLDRVDEAYAQHQLRHLQPVHYRVNELGDIQTEPTQHGGLTDFGAQVVRRCNDLGIVVDVAHGTFDLVKRAASVSSKPLVLSHTALSAHPGGRSRLISADHARAVADTGGVIGVWPSSGTFRDLQGMAEGVKRMADVVGVDHVGMGTDMLGFISPPVFSHYGQLPDLANQLLAAGFSNEETRKILGENYRRVFEASADVFLANRWSLRITISKK
jgi:membrane dipeptidase